jgi:acetate kinase
MKILVLNSGSSSQKTAVFELGPASADDPIPPLWEGRLDWDGDQEQLTIRNAARKSVRQQKRTSARERQASLETLLENIWNGETAVLNSASEIGVVGHRIVHGGPKLTQPTLVTDDVIRTIAEVVSIAPLHNRAGLAGIALLDTWLPRTPQVAVFDTGFHRTLAPEAKIYAGPYAWYEHGIQRYGFHGINHEYCARRAARLLNKDLATLKIVICHLGNGCSLAAISGGKSVNTTMGFTPLEGLMMGTRAGSIDPGIITHLLRTGEVEPNQLDDLLNRRGGLLGISGISSNMHDILEAIRKGDERAKLAFDIFVHRLTESIGAMAASLGGMHVLVFSAGIGENSGEVRNAACAKLEFLGVKLDLAKNSAAKPDLDVSSASSLVRVLVIRAQEEWAIARQCVRVVDSA